MSKWIKKMAVAVAVGLVTWSLVSVPSASAQDAAAPAEATVEQRVADLEMYFQNLGVGGSGDTTWASKIAGVPGPGHNTWLMISCALVLFMTLPGLALFYGGLVRQKNILSVMAQCLGITSIVVFLWWAVGYSLVFGKSFDSAIFYGGLEKMFFKGVTSAPNTDYCYWVSENIFAMFQLMFAIITPALIVGAIAERMKFAAIALFVVIWMFAVYFPLAHMVWGVNGFMNGVWNSAAVIPAMDFAGGTVVHMSSGWSALVLCIMLGKRLGFGKESMAPHSMVLCMVGTGMLWVGWYGFNAGSALAADGIASNAFTTTTIAAALAAGTWALCEVITRGKASILGFCSGAVAGLVVVTPACGFISPQSAAIVGLLAGVIPFIFCTFVKKAAGYDDALDTFGIHAVGGTLGALLTGFLADSSVNGNLTAVNTLASPKLIEAVEKGTAWIYQLQAIGFTVVLSVVATIIITLIVKAVFGLRVTEEVELAGLDVSEHGEEGYTH